MTFSTVCSLGLVALLASTTNAQDLEPETVTLEVRTNLSYLWVKARLFELPDAIQSDLSTAFPDAPFEVYFESTPDAGETSYTTIFITASTENIHAVQTALEAHEFKLPSVSDMQPFQEEGEAEGVADSRTLSLDAAPQEAQSESSTNDADADADAEEPVIVGATSGATQVCASALLGLSALVLLALN